MAGLSLGMSFGGRFRRDCGDSYGPELVTTPIGTGWTASAATVTIGATSVTFTNANANDCAFLALASLQDDTTYLLTYRITAMTGGANKGRAFGPTTGKSGITSGHTTVGTYTEEITTSGTGTNTGRVQIQATGGVAGSNNFTCDLFSLKKKVDVNGPGHLMDEANAMLTDEAGAQLTGPPA